MSDTRDGGDWTIKFFHSTNNGVSGSFSGPVDDVNSRSDARYPAVAASGGNVHVAWVEGANVWLSSSNGGANLSWDGAINISNSGNVHNYRPGLAAFGNDAFAAWSGADDIFFSSTLEPGRVYNITAGVAIHKREPSVGVSLNQDGTLHVRLAWRETSSGKPVIRFKEAFWDDVADEFVWGIDLNDDGAIAGNEVDQTVLVHTGHAGDDYTPELAVAQTGVVYALWHNSQLGALAARYLGPSPYRQPPTNLTAQGGDLRVTLNWVASVSPDVNSYRIYRGVTRGDWAYLDTVDASVLTFTDTTVFNNTIYWYAVRAVFGADESPISNQVSVTPGVQADDVEPPVPPTNLLALPGSGSVSLSWDASVSPDLERYHVYSRTSTTDSFVFVGQVPADEAEFEHDGLTNGIVYQYVVTVIDANNNESADSDSAWAIPGTADYGTGVPPGDEPGTAPAPSPRRPDAVSMDPGSGSGCFIATAAFGSELAGEVGALYGFRDACLMKSRAGRAFVSAYYSFSPVIADLIGNNSALKSVMRLHLIPVVSIIQLMS